MFKFSFSNLALIAILASTTQFVAVNRSVAQSADTSNSSKVIRSREGQTVTQEMLDNWIELGELLAGSNFTTLEKQVITSVSQLEFYKNPQEQVDLYNFAGKWTKKLEESSSVTRTKMKEFLFAQFYLEGLKQTDNNLGNVKMLMRTVDNYVEVVATDREAEIVVTQSDLDSILASYNFMAQLARKPLRSGIDTAKVQQSFSQLPLEQKKDLAQGEGNWQEMQVSWANMSAEQQQKIEHELIEEAGNSEPTPSQNESARSENSGTEENAAQANQNSDSLTLEQQQKLAETNREIAEQGRAAREAMREAQSIMDVQNFLMF